MNALWIEPFGGLAGDMWLASLLDLEDPRFTLEELERVASSLVPDEFDLEASRVQRGGLSATHLAVRTPETDQTPHRHLSDLLPLVDRSCLSEAARLRAHAVLIKLAEAEARVHGTTPDKVHFHEVGAVDTLIDVCGVCHALAQLEIERVYSSPPITGEGTVRCAHGEMPVPVPAVVELLRGRELRTEGGRGERLTPTGAALLAEWTESFAPPSRFSSDSIGYGAGTRDPQTGPPNLVRVQLGSVQGEDASGRGEVDEVRVTLDDMTAEQIGYLVSTLRSSGALEVWTHAVQMKKDRPGTVVSYLCRPELRETLEGIVFANSTSFGLRWSRGWRTECGREFDTVSLLGEEVRIKLRMRPGKALAASPEDVHPEHDDLARLALASGQNLAELRRLAIAAYLERG